MHPHRLPLLALAACALACEAAGPLPASDAGRTPDVTVDRALPAPDLAPACPDADEDGVRRADCVEPGRLADCDDGDPLIRPGASDPCGDGVDQDCDGADTMCPVGCTPNADLAPCDEVDDDCDGSIDECAPGQRCQDAVCVAAPGEVCSDAVACARGSDCIDGACVPIEPGGLCAADRDCPVHAFCGLNALCDEFDPRCYGLQGSRCVEPCDCGGMWVCGADIGHCARCLFDGQCDGASACTPGGLCAVPTALGGEGEALDRLLAVLLDCRATHGAAANAEGCAILDTGRLFTDGAEIGALERPIVGDARVCDAVALAGRGYDGDSIEAIRAMFGCEGPPQITWEAPIAAEREAAACVSHLPQWSPTPGVIIAPCAAVVYARGP